MQNLRLLATVEIGGFLATLFTIVVLRLLGGGITTEGLLSERRRGGRARLSPARVQLLAMTLADAAGYLLLTLKTYAAHTMPDVPVALPTILATSHGVYLSSKGFPVLLAKLREAIR